MFLDQVINEKRINYWLYLNFVRVGKLFCSAFFLTVVIGNCMEKLIPPVNFCSDENIQTIFGTKLEDFLNYWIDYNSKCVTQSRTGFTNL
jgi:hypothetical protein